MKKQLIKILGICAFVYLALGSASTQPQSNSGNTAQSNSSSSNDLMQQGLDLMSGRCDITGRCNVICNNTPGGMYCR
jgi:hypothetical protein